jgi:hypothetical protein
MYRQFLSDTHTVLLPVGSEKENIRYLHQTTSHMASVQKKKSHGHSFHRLFTDRSARCKLGQVNYPHSKVIIAT